MELTGITPALSAKLWDALMHNGHATVRRLTWFLHRLETRPVAALAAQMAGFNAALRPQQWVALLEECVRQGRLSRQESNNIIDAILGWTRADGGWRYQQELDP
jgi:hypothetical protein